MLLRQIEYFQSVVRNNNFTLAAEEHHISQSAISQQIKALEDELGVELLARKNRRFALTEAGEHFYKRSLVITADMKQLCRETVRLGQKDTAALAAGFLITYDGDEFTRALAAFAEAYPAVTVNIMSGNHEDLYDALFPTLEELSIGLVAFSPLANGFLSDRYTKDSRFEQGVDFRSFMPQFTAQGMEDNRPLPECVRSLAEEKYATPAQISLAWMLGKKPYIVPIPGTRKPERLTENLGAADVALTADEITKIDKLLSGMKPTAVYGVKK